MPGCGRHLQLDLYTQAINRDKLVAQNQVMEAMMKAGVGELRYAEYQLLIEGFLALPQFAGWSVLRPKSCFLRSVEHPETDIIGDSNRKHAIFQSMG